MTTLKINVRRDTIYKDISVESYDTTINLGLHSKEECEDLSETLLNAADELNSKKLHRLRKIEAAALAIDGIEMRNCVEIPLAAWEYLQSALNNPKG